MFFFIGSLEFVKKLESDENLMKNKSAQQGLADMKTLLEYLDLFNVLDKVGTFFKRQGLLPNDMMKVVYFKH